MTRLHTLPLSLAIALAGCTAESVGDGTGMVSVTTDCTVTALGTLPAGDEFDGVGSGLSDGFAEGAWEHLTPLRDGEVPPCDCDDDIDEDMDEDVDEDMDEDFDEDMDEDFDEDMDEDFDEGDDDDSCDGHNGRGRGHEFRRGRGHHEHGNGRGCGHSHDDDDDDECVCDTEPEQVRDRLEGQVEAVTCFINGSRVGVVQGTGAWNGDPGYGFEVSAIDGGADDEYTITVTDPGGTVVYTANGFPDSGDIIVVDF